MNLRLHYWNVSVWIISPLSCAKRCGDAMRENAVLVGRNNGVKRSKKEDSGEEQIGRQRWDDTYSCITKRGCKVFSQLYIYMGESILALWCTHHKRLDAQVIRYRGASRHLSGCFRSAVLNTGVSLGYKHILDLDLSYLICLTEPCSIDETEYIGIVK